MPAKIAVFGLFYGDYPHLAQRLLDSWARWRDDSDLDWHLGLNNICHETDKLIARFWGSMEDGENVSTYRGSAPYWKYPLMRRMFRSALCGGADYFMWFDDDSLILPDAPDTFFDDVRSRMRFADMMGSVWYYPLAPYYDYIQKQSWFRGRLQPTTPDLAFCTGGWWTIRSSIIRKHDWPPSDFHHNGGDAMLGALCAEQGYRIVDDYTHVGVNCDDSYKNSSAPRRGQSLMPIGGNYNRTDGTS